MRLKAFLREMWPVAVTAAGAVIIACELPRKAIFQEKLENEHLTTWASFVSFDETTCARILADARAAWQVRAAALLHDTTGYGLFDAVDMLAQGGSPSIDMERRKREMDLPPSIGEMPPVAAFKPPSLAACEEAELPPEKVENGTVAPAFSREELLEPPFQGDLL